MTEITKEVISDDNQQTSGQVDQNQQTEDKVAYKTYTKVLGEKKKVSEELANLRKELETLQNQAKEREESELKQKEDWKTLLDQRTQELEQVRSELTQVAKDRVDAKKLDAFLQSVKGDIDRKYWGLIPIDDIVLNPDSGEIDGMTVTKVVEAFQKQYPETIKTMQAKLPNTAPKDGGQLTYEQWLKLPAKEMQARYNEVYTKE